VAVLDKVDSGDTDAIIKAMVGREITELYPVKGHTPGKTRLKVENLGDGGKFSGVSFQVAVGEILGIAGLVGSGREELTDAIYGLRQLATGRLILEEEPTPITSPVKAVANRLVLVPRDRRNDGLVLEMALEDNINLASLSEVALAGMERSGLARQRALQQIHKLDIRPTDPRTTVKLLSGGNQQKTVLARWLATQSRVFILDEPTVGVDIGARVEIYQLIEDLAVGGAAIIVSSSDPSELLGLCDRLIVMVRGELIANRAADELTLDSLLSLTTCSDAASGNNHNSRVAS
jgi:ribose transport system ATP-binding protein